MNLSPTFLQSVEDMLTDVMFEDTCTVFLALNTGSTGLGASDGEGGYGDSEGGSTTTYDSGTSGIPCKLDMLTGGGESQKNEVNSSRTRQILYIPASTVIFKTSIVVTSAGNNGIARRFQVIDIYRETGQVDIGVLLESISDGIM